MDGSSLQFKPTVVVSITPDYSIGDVIGGIISLAGMTGAGRSGVLKDIFIQDGADQKKGISFYFFNALPTGTYTDNAAFAWGSGDFAKCCGAVHVVAADYTTLASKATATVEVARSIQSRATPPATNPEATPMYVIMVATEAINFAATDDLSVTFGYLRD